MNEFAARVIVTRLLGLIMNQMVANRTQCAVLMILGDVFEGLFHNNTDQMA